MKIRAEINELETRGTVKQINKTRSWLIVRINKINNPLARFIQKTRERLKLVKL